MKFMFITENGSFELEYEDYLRNEDLVNAIGDARRRFLNLGRVLISYPFEWLAQHTKERKDFDLLEQEQLANPVRFYMPCSARSGFKSAAHRFINDIRHSACIMRAGNRFGKSVAAWIKQLVARGVIPCDPRWEIFTENGVQFVPWSGPKKIGVGTYQWENHRRAIWPGVIQAWTPSSELGEYRKGGSKIPNFQNSPSITLACGSEIQMSAYNQSQNAFESDAKDGWMWDEQADEAKFDGANMRCATRRWWYQKDGIELVGGGWHDFSMTPHDMEDRQNTGTDTFVHEMEDGTRTKGLTVAAYQGSVLDDTPDWVYRERTKREEKKSWLDEPLAMGDLKRYREGRARLLGEYHVSTGLVYDTFDEDVHVIDDFPLGMDWTRYRGIDHGKKHPFVCVYAAVTDKDDIIIYDIYVGVGKDVSDNINNVVRKAGNILVPAGHMTVKEGYETKRIARKREVMCGTRFKLTVLDSRSFKKPQDNSSLTLGDLYALHGIPCVPASGLPNNLAIPIVSELFKVRPNVKHLVHDRMGAPKVYIFRSCSALIKAINRYRYSKKEGSVKERVMDGKDDEVDAMKYLLQAPLKYIPGFSSKLETAEELVVIQPKKVVRDVYSGW